ncbi:MAG: rhodanese-like domain-containing protein [Gammaproteobacteria bacterium]|nr:rhodanese-like domain-containing protein [Gammaproteobacteria bacterium]
MIFRFFGLFLLLITLSACTEPPYNNIDNGTLKTMLEQGMPIYDVRRPDEWRQTGVIKNSRLLTFVDGSGRVKPDFLDKFTSAVGKNDPVILICRTGNRTSSLARHLVEKMGYTQIYNVHDGITRWISEGNSVTQL